MLLGDVVDELHDEDRFADASAAEEADFTAFGVGGDQVDDFDASFENFGRALLVGEGRRVAVNAPAFGVFGLGTVVDRLAEKVENAAECAFSDGNRDRFAGVDSLFAAGHAVCGGHCDAADNVVAKLLLDLADDLAAFVNDLNRVEQVGQVAVLEADVENRTDYLNNFTGIFFHLVFPF